MTKYEIAILVCRSLGIYCFIAALNSLQSLVFGVTRVIPMLSAPSSARLSSVDVFWTMVTSSAPSALQILFGIALWLGAPLWARLMLRAPQPPFDDPLIAAPSTPVALLDTLKNAALWFLGLLALLHGVPQLASSTATAYSIWQQQMPAGRTTSLSVWAYWMPQFVLSLAKIILGLVLLLMARNSSRPVVMPANNAAPETSLPS